MLTTGGNSLDWEANSPPSWHARRDPDEGARHSAVDIGTRSVTRRVGPRRRSRAALGVCVTARRPTALTELR